MGRPCTPRILGSLTTANHLVPDSCWVPGDPGVSAAYFTKQYGASSFIAFNPATGRSGVVKLQAAVATAAGQAQFIVHPSAGTTNGLLSVAVSAAGTSFNSGDVITTTAVGGTMTTPVTLIVNSTALVSAPTITTAGVAGGYVAGGTITLAGGTASTAATLNVTHTKVVAATIVAGGTAGTNGTQTVTGTTGTGTKFTASVTVAGGIVTAILSIISGGDYTVNPTSVAIEPVTGPGPLTGATLAIKMAPLTVTFATGGVYTTNGLALTDTTGDATYTATVANYGVNVASITNAGAFSVNSTSFTEASVAPGVGTGVTFGTPVFGPISIQGTAEHLKKIMYYTIWTIEGHIYKWNPTAPSTTLGQADLTMSAVGGGTRLARMAGEKAPPGEKAVPAEQAGFADRPMLGRPVSKEAPEETNRGGWFGHPVDAKNVSVDKPEIAVKPLVKPVDKPEIVQVAVKPLVKPEIVPPVEPMEKPTPIVKPVAVENKPTGPVTPVR